MKRTDLKSKQISAAHVWSGWARGVASLLIAFHLLAVFTGPWSGPPPASPLSQQVARALMPYLVAAHLNHGYRFFAPNPGPSHLIRYELESHRGGLIEGRFPDPYRHWPRLLYHRHFMVSEAVFNLLFHPFFMDMEAMFTGSGPLLAEPLPADVPASLRADLEVNRRRAEALIHGIARQLLAEHGAHRVRLFLVQHDIALPMDVQRGMQLDDPALFHERFLVELTEDDL